MKSSFIKNHLKDLLLKSVASVGDGTFVDGLVLGLLLSSDTDSTDTLLDLFGEWRDSARDMELTEDKKKLFMYVAYFMTYTKGRVLLQNKFGGIRRSIKKRDKKLERK